MTLAKETQVNRRDNVMWWLTSVNALGFVVKLLPMCPRIVWQVFLSLFKYHVLRLKSMFV